MDLFFCWLLALASVPALDGAAMVGASTEWIAETPALSTRRATPPSCGPTTKGLLMAADYRLDTCASVSHPATESRGTWCEIRSDGKPQCRACQIERFFENVLYAPFRYKLQTWGRKVLRDLYGNVHPETGLRLYRRAYVSTAKQNGKSFIIGGLPIYHLLMEDEFQPEAYGVASARDQAGIVFKAAATLVEANPLLKAKLKVLESTKRIVRRDGHGLYCVLSADGEVQDGKRPSLLLFDELHRFTRKKAETVRTVLLKGMISRAPVVDGVPTGEPLMIQTTTSGDEYESPLWFSEYQYAQQVQSGGIVDPSYYSVIYQADPQRIESEKEYWKSREARVAANPSHQDNGGFLADAEIEKDMLEVVSRPEKYADYVRLNLNVPVVATGTPIIDMPTWCQGGGADDLRTWPSYDVEYLIMKWGLKNRPCYIGVDLAWTTDMTAMSIVFPPEGDEEWKLLFFTWLPEARLSHIARITRAPLADWVKRGFVASVPGVKMNLSVVEEKIRWAANTFDVREMCFDKWGGMIRSAEVLADEGMTCVDIDQKSFAMLSPATKEFLALYLAGKLLHGNNPVMNWHVSCLGLEHDAADNVKPRKPARDNSQKRIDLVAATVNAMVRAVVGEESTIAYTGGFA